MNARRKTLACHQDVIVASPHCHFGLPLFEHVQLTVSLFHMTKGDSMDNEILTAERFSVTETAHRLNVHVSTVWRWIHRGIRGRRLETVRVGGRRFVLRKTLENYLNNEPISESETPVTPIPPTKRLEQAQTALARFGV
jgi:excisionase family DNA binding protein